MTDARAYLWFESPHGEYVEIETSQPPVQRVEPVRIQRTIDMRVRPEFREWRATLHIGYLARLVKAERVLSWISLAGISVGIGEMRPLGRESSGPFGRFRVVEADCSEPIMDEVDNGESKTAKKKVSGKNRISSK
jgi:hypothetical protein